MVLSHFIQCWKRSQVSTWMRISQGETLQRKSTANHICFSLASKAPCWGHWWVTCHLRPLYTPKGNHIINQYCSHIKGLYLFALHINTQPWTSGFPRAFDPAGL